MKIIGLVGFAGSGKDTAGEILLNSGFKRESFAVPVKDAVAAIFGWDREVLEGLTPESRKWREEPDKFWSEKFDTSFTPRIALQKMGTEVGREIYHSDIWVHALENRLNINNDYVITDVRFSNEIEKINKLGGFVFRIKRGKEPIWYEEACEQNQQNRCGEYITEDLQELRRQRVSRGVLATIHPSEWSWCGHPGISFVIENDGTLEDLKKKILDISNRF